MKLIQSTVTDGDIYNAEICEFYAGSDVTCNIAAFTSAGSSPNATTNVTLPCVGELVQVFILFLHMPEIYDNFECIWPTNSKFVTKLRISLGLQVHIKHIDSDGSLM